MTPLLVAMKAQDKIIHETRKTMNDSLESVWVITCFITFLATWIYSIATYGFFLVISFGWIPFLIIAVILGTVLTPISIILLVLLLGPFILMERIFRKISHLKIKPAKSDDLSLIVFFIVLLLLTSIIGFHTPSSI